MEAMGIKKNMLKVTGGALRQIIDEYTMEAGVRDLKKSIETLCRTAAVELVRGSAAEDAGTEGATAEKPRTEDSGLCISVTKSNLSDYLGRKQIRTERRLSSGTSGQETDPHRAQAVLRDARRGDRTCLDPGRRRDPLH